MLPPIQALAKQERHETSKTSGRKRARSSFSTLSTSSSCPHLPLISAGTSSPAAITSTLAFGATTPTAEIFPVSSSTNNSAKGTDDNSSSSTHTRLSMSGFPWEHRSSPGNLSPAAELTGSIARRSRPATPPAPLVHAKSEPLTTTFDKKTSPKSNLRLELPPPRMDGALRGMEVTTDTFNSESHRSRFAGQPLLGLAFPTTPDIGINNSPVMYGSCRDGERMQSGMAETGGVVVTRGGAVVGGGAAAAAQHVLLAAGSHMGRGGLALLTPPDDNGVLDWRHDNVGIIADYEPTTVKMIGKQDQPTAKEVISDTLQQVNVNPNCNRDSSDAKIPEQLPSTSVTSSTSTTPKPPKEITVSTDEQHGQTRDDWIESAMDALIGSTMPVTNSTEAVRILSYVLPCPLPDTPTLNDPTLNNPMNPDRLPASAASAPSVAAAAGYELSPTIEARCSLQEGRASPAYSGSMTTALHSITASIQRRYVNEGPRRVYIHVSHAIDPQIPLSRLPSTPPLTSGGNSGGIFGTPGYESGDMGYFSPTVFNSIVVAPGSMTNTSTTTTPIVGTPIHQHPSVPAASPNPILPPNSLHLTLLERYIPPFSPEEDRLMFSTTSSIIIDRLFELSPNGGSLLFIYPTKTGAMTFDREYLGQVLDPLLRKLMVLYALRDDLLWNIRSVSSLHHLAEFPELCDRMKHFCAAISTGHSKLPKTATKLVYSAKVEVSLNELSWREWWTTQEQMRIRECIKKHVASQPAAAKSAKAKETENQSGYWQGYGVPGDLLREVLDGVRAPSVRPSSRGMGEAVLASSMSGSGAMGGSATAGVGCATGEPRSSFAKPRKGVEVGVFVLKRGLDP